ncbi:unnamed protein product [Ranitomeya imitator]|uniref:Uncharacterized protein n=1 Tax=Ranitomeya imitator TaxID=111125 RepID=A0ABN9M1C1_9NEOB|nr:unnamed protein product [Ranitomeya imitator]
MTTTWKAGLTSNQIIKISVSSVVFALGLISLMAGVVWWKNAKKSGPALSLLLLLLVSVTVCSANVASTTLQPINENGRSELLMPPIGQRS